jgi:hypothetical protein
VAHSDEAIPLDGTVGSFDQLEAKVPFATSEDVPIRISVAGDAVSDPAAMGLAEDLALLVDGFMRRRASATEEKTRTQAPRDSGADSDIQVALHGLQLDSGAEQELHHLIREFVRERIAPREAAK